MKNTATGTEEKLPAKRKIIPGKTRLEKMVMPEIKVIDAKDGKVQATLSAEVEDRDGDIIVQKGWVLDYFEAHPVLLASHNYYSLRSQIGEWQDVTVKGKKLIGVAKYYIGEGNEEADWGYKIASKGKAAFSVGFIPLDAEERSETERPSWGGWKFTKCELLECSHVTVPSNPAALQNLAESKFVDPGLRQIAKSLLANSVVTENNEGQCIFSQDCKSNLIRDLPLCEDHYKLMTGVAKALYVVNSTKAEASEEDNMKLDMGNVKLDVSEMLLAGKTVSVHYTPSDDGAVDMEIKVVEPAVLSAIEETEEKEVEEKEETEVIAKDHEDGTEHEHDEESEEKAEEETNEEAEESEESEDEDSDEEKGIDLDEIFAASFAEAFRS